MERWVGRVALVTGASAGIGAAIAETLVKQGMKVVGCARNVGQIQAISDKLKGEQGYLHPVKCDLTKESEILGMFEDIKKKYGGVDVLVNNAGVSHDAPLLEGSTEEWRNMLDVNVIAVAICTREAIRSMRHRGIDDGQVIHINSMSGHRIVSVPTGHFYSMSKFAVRAHLEGLRNELRQMKSNIRASEISPGVVGTEMVLTKQGRKENKSLKYLQAKDIADSVIYILSAPPHVQVHDVLVRHTQQPL